MTGAEIAQLLIIFGPRALDLIEKLIATWTKQLTTEEVLAFIKQARKSYDEYVGEDAADPAAPPV